MDEGGWREGATKGRKRSNPATTHQWTICSFYNLAKGASTAALEDPRGSAINEPKELTRLQWLPWLTLRASQRNGCLKSGTKKSFHFRTCVATECEFTSASRLVIGVDSTSPLACSTSASYIEPNYNTKHEYRVDPTGNTRLDQLSEYIFC